MIRPDTTEEWRDIPGYPGYQASNTGRIRSIDRAYPNSRGVMVRYKGRVLSTYVNKNGYVYSSPMSNADVKAKRNTVHRLVCLAFHGLPPFNDSDVMHLNSVRTDNRAENLAWGSRQENLWEAVRIRSHAGSRKTECPRGHQLCDPNIQYSPARTPGRRSRTCLACARARARVHEWKSRKGVDLDMSLTADAYYDDIMRGN